MQWSKSIATLVACFLAIALTACGGGVTASQAATPTALTITTQPDSQTVVAGQSATFTVIASGSGTLTYQWKKNGTNIPGATSNTYTTPPTNNTDNGAAFSVIVSNNAGSATGKATLTVTDIAVAPTIATQPENQTVTAGQTASFSVTATGTAPLIYQWKKGSTVIPGATSSSYTTPEMSIAGNGAVYSVVVTNGVGTVTSSSGTLTVNKSLVTGYSLVANASGGSYDKTECVKENSTGLIWEGKNPSGGSTRSTDARYTNYDSTSSAQKWDGSAYVNTTQTEIDASTNSIGYVNSVNASALCGYTDWRLPTSVELQGIVVTGTSPTIDTTWFPNTQANYYWSSSPFAGISGNAFSVYFNEGDYSDDSRGSYYYVRLVR